MTTLTQEPLETPAAPTRHWLRRHPKLAAAAVLALLLVASGVGWLVYISTYQPIGLASSSVTGPEPNVRIATDGLMSETYLIDSPPGQPATVEYTLANNGPFAITITPQHPLSWMVFHVTYGWALLPATGELPPGTHPHAMPFVVPPHRAVQLYVTVDRLTTDVCEKGSSIMIDSLPIAWKALGVHHVTTLHLSPLHQSLQPIAACFSNAALARAER